METAGRHLEDKELSAAMKERGLGTPATRADIIETLLKRQYLTRDGKSLIPTERGLRLIQLVQPPIKSKADNSAEKRSRIGTLMKVLLPIPQPRHGAAHLPIYP